MPAHQVVHRLDVADRLGHLRARQGQHAVVQPGAGEDPAAVRAFALRHLVLVVRELQVDTAGVDVDALAQVGGGHGRAFDVPARAAAPPGRVPARQIVAGGLPQHEVAGAALVRRHLDPGTGEHLVGVAAGQLAVAWEGVDREQHVAFGRVGVAGVDQPPDHLHHLRDVRGGRRFDVRREVAVHPERGHVLAVGGGETVGDRRDRHAGRARGGVDLVVDVGDVARVAQRAVAPPQQGGEHPEHHRAARVADMHVVVDRGPADVHGRAGRVGGRECLDPAGQAVEQVQGHRRAATGNGRF